MYRPGPCAVQLAVEVRRPDRRLALDGRPDDAGPREARAAMKHPRRTVTTFPQPLVTVGRAAGVARARALVGTGRATGGRPPRKSTETSDSREDSRQHRQQTRVHRG